MSKRDKVLIAGSSGMLGVDLSRELGESYEVYGIDLADSSKLEARRYNRCDITDRSAVLKAVTEFAPHVIIHTAAWTDVDGCELDKEKAYKINGDGTKNVALACKGAGAMLVYISTDFVFDGRSKGPYKETDPAAPLSIYGGSKLMGEEAVKKELKEYFILRTSWLYGKSGKNFVDTIIAKAASEKVLRVVDDQVGSPTYTVDLAEAIHVLIDKVRAQRTEHREQRYGIYHVSNSGSVSWYKYAKEILALAGSPAKVVPISSAELNRPARRPANSVLYNSKFVKFTGHELRGWKDALREYIKLSLRERSEATDEAI